MLILKLILWFTASWLILWIGFLAIMLLKQLRDCGQLTKDMPAYKIGMIVLFLGYTIDLIVNLLPATILFLEFPKELTVTARCSRLLSDMGFRGSIARWLCHNLLDPFELHGHCH